MVTMHVEIMLGLLLFFAWAQSFSKRALAWWGSAHLLRAVSIMLFGMHGSIPDWVSIDVANAVLFGSFALTWSGARVFDRRSAGAGLALVGVVIWLLACRLPEFATIGRAARVGRLGHRDDLHLARGLRILARPGRGADVALARDLHAVRARRAVPAAHAARRDRSTCRPATRSR